MFVVYVYMCGCVVACVCVRVELSWGLIVEKWAFNWLEMTTENRAFIRLI